MNTHFFYVFEIALDPFILCTQRSWNLKNLSAKPWVSMDHRQWLTRDLNRGGKISWKGAHWPP